MKKFKKFYDSEKFTFLDTETAHIVEYMKILEEVSALENCDIFARLPGSLLPWYEANRRDLPWRKDKEPYHIWISEIMLQQTRVEAVKGYYTRFLDVLPDVKSLAYADDELLHKLWEGLGYYSRVRNLKKAALQIMQNHDGVFPMTHEGISALAGIGPYTAGAVCSIAYNLPTPAVDGNVMRVLSRLTDDATPIDKPAFRKRITEALAAVYPERAGDFTQSLMELGATICGPNRKPDCENCPCKAFCLGYMRGTAADLPVKKDKPQRRVEEKTVLILSCDGSYALRKRPDKGLLAGLWEFPHISGKSDISYVITEVEKIGLKPKELIRQVEKKHIFTHIEWQMSGVYMEVKECCGDFVWMDATKINEEAALPTAFRQFWEETGYV